MKHRLLKWWFKKRGSFNYSGMKLDYAAEWDNYEIDVTVREWRISDDCVYREINCEAYGPRRDYRHGACYVTGLPWISNWVASRPGVGISLSGDTTQFLTITSLTRADQIRTTVKALKSMIDGHGPTDFETEQAVREAFVEDDDEQTLQL